MRKPLITLILSGLLFSQPTLAFFGSDDDEKTIKPVSERALLEDEKNRSKLLLDIKYQVKIIFQKCTLSNVE